jgi:uroporphyrinogen decarboxylase
MLPRERVIAALEHREPDRIPWGEHSIDYNVYEDILGRPTLDQAKMRTTQAYWDGRRDEVVESVKRDRIDLIRALEIDLIHISAVPPKGYQPEPMEKLDDATYRNKDGALYRVSATTHDLRPWKPAEKSNYIPPTIESLQKEIDELESSPPEDPDDSKWEAVHHVVKEMKATHFIALMSDDLAFPGFGATEEEFWMNLVLEPEICRKRAELKGRQILRTLDVQAKLGVDAIVPCGDLGSSKNIMASPAIYREMVYPWHKLHVAKAHRLGLKVLKHCCGHIWPVIREIAEVYDCYEGIQASAGMDIARLKREVGRELCLWGGIWHEHIILGSAADIRNDARHAFGQAAPGGGYIMGSSHSLAVDAKVENILQMKRCRDEWGGYPIRPDAWGPIE